MHTRASLLLGRPNQTLTPPPRHQAENHLGARVLIHIGRSAQTTMATSATTTLEEGSVTSGRLLRAHHNG